MSYSTLEFETSLKLRLANPAVTDDEVTAYIISAKREVNSALYAENDYIEQVLDTACHKLCLDNKFPEVQSVSQNGVTTSFSGNDPERYIRRITERRQAMMLVSGDYA